MPYTKEEINRRIDPKINELLKEVEFFGLFEQAGIFTRIIYRIAIAITTKKYWRFALTMGAIFCAALEFWRRRIVPYENEKIKEHGDIL